MVRGGWVLTRRRIGELRGEALGGLFAGSAGVAIRGLFDRMTIAEEEIARLEREPPGAFSTVYPTPVLRGKRRDLYRAHVRELLERLERGAGKAKLEEATDAELLAGMYEASARAPLSSEASAVYDRLFSRIFPEKWRSLGWEATAEAWKGQVDEDIRAARRAMRVPGRSESASESARSRVRSGAGRAK